MLSVRDVNKTFGGVKALTEVSFELMPGDILGVIGPNGSGKTTLVNVITGFVKADSGQVLYKGKNLVGTAPHK
ncbi:MAG: ATP-binding cassette domain-containing protein, partial [Proteobacteria bacterium]|nr:ATP-binding cassette domain-containing protein [Pseudomonadota bacterium]MBU1450155.1 ATP-binding cassette domain-containing protein [Pseudomonadota bacterium]